MEYGEKTFHLEMAVPSEYGKIEKKTKCKELGKACTEMDWDKEFHLVAVGCREYADKKTVKTFRDRFYYSYYFFVFCSN